MYKSITAVDHHLRVLRPNIDNISILGRQVALFKETKIHDYHQLFMILGIIWWV